MFFDLNVPLPTPALSPTGQPSKKGKQKQQAGSSVVSDNGKASLFSPAQISSIEAHIDILVHLGYTVLALNQIVQSKIDPRTHVDWLQGLIPKLKKRTGIAVLKRLTVVLDEDSDKGNGISPQSAAVLSNYDIISLRPTTMSAFSQACLTHSVPSPQTAHIINIPVTLPRLPFHLKHTLIRTALKNGAVFEIDYAGAVGPENERRHWWGGARELMRVTKGKGILLSGGANDDKELRAPRDAANLITLLGIPQNLSHDAVAQTPKSVILRAQSRKTYRAILSEPRLIIPEQPPSAEPTDTSGSASVDPARQPQSESSQAAISTVVSSASVEPDRAPTVSTRTPEQQLGKTVHSQKRQRDEGPSPVQSTDGVQKKKKKKKK